MKRMICVMGLLILVQLCMGQNRFHHILITNDDGIEDEDRLLALAQTVIHVSDRVSIIVPDEDRSGTSNHTTFGKHRSSLEITCIYEKDKDGISVYTMPGNPADCVLLGLAGFFRSDRPDLVLSGINGGSNIGPAWFGSGTIGAVRMAAFLGVKAAALSGFEDEYPESFVLIPDWIARFISSGILDVVENNTYFTIGFPEIPPKEIRGVRLADRQITFSKAIQVEFHQTEGDDPHNAGNQSVWALNRDGDWGVGRRESDTDWLAQGFIVITPMTINENHPRLLNTMNEMTDLIPYFNQ